MVLSSGEDFSRNVRNVRRKIMEEARKRIVTDVNGVLWYLVSCILIQSQTYELTKNIIKCLLEKTAPKSQADLLRGGRGRSGTKRKEIEQSSFIDQSFVF